MGPEINTIAEETAKLCRTDLEKYKYMSIGQVVKIRWGRSRGFSRGNQ